VITSVVPFAEKVRLAVETSPAARRTSGLRSGSTSNSDLKPVGGSVRAGRSFAYLHDERLRWARDRFQLEVFHWMTELTTRPFFSPEATAAEARLLEGALLNTLAELRLSFGESFFAHHGNIAGALEVGLDSIPDGWNLARKRYLRRCVSSSAGGSRIGITFPCPEACYRGTSSTCRWGSAASARSSSTATRR
jgi:hypothetical protein